MLLPSYQMFAADAFLACVAVGHNALARRNNSSTKTTENARKLVLTSINAQTRLGDALDAANSASLLLTVLEGDGQNVAGLSRLDFEAVDVALFLHDAGDFDKLLAGRHGNRLLASRVSVTHTRKHICNRIVHAHCCVSPLFMMSRKAGSHAPMMYAP